MSPDEFCLKDYIAQVIELTDVFDERVNTAGWISVDKSRILAQRDVAASVGAILIHPLLGWHEPDTVNERYVSLSGNAPIADDESQSLQRLWIIRHSVAHNAGFVTHHDAYRLRAATLRESAVQITQAFLTETVSFLGGIVQRLAEDKPIGKSIMGQWIRLRSTGVWADDRDAYKALRLVMTVEKNRVRKLPSFTTSYYTKDRQAAGM